MEAAGMNSLMNGLVYDQRFTGRYSAEEVRFED
jgi:hypothetical protein